MKKFQIVFLIIFGAVAALYAIGRITGALVRFSVPTKSSEPAIKRGSHVWASNLKTPQRMDFILYRSTMPEYENEIWFHRLIGLPGDTILIKDNELYVNGINQDVSMNLKKEYEVHRDVVSPLNLPEEEVFYRETNDSAIAILESIGQKDLIKQGHLHLDDYEDEHIKARYGKPWNVYNFGPYVVKPNTYFVLGDNRNRSADSRFSGPVKMENYVSTVLNK